jgi:hypothetical protein
MAVILWSVLALILVGLVVLVAAYRTRAVLPPLELAPGEELPAAPVQRLTRWATGLGLVVGAAAAGIVAWVGPTVYGEDDTIRLTVTGLALAALLLLAIPSLVAGMWAASGDRRVDERDKAIVARAPAGQAAAILVVLAVWTIALQEGYRGAAGIPRDYLYLIMWSCLLVSLVASNAGILIGYRRG